MENRFNRLLAAASIDLTNEQKQRLLGYVTLLDKWNKAYNLTSVRDPQEMLVRHVMDSIVVNPHLSGTQFIDVGTGIGCPVFRLLLSGLIPNSRC